MTRLIIMALALLMAAPALAAPKNKPATLEAANGRVGGAVGAVLDRAGIPPISVGPTQGSGEGGGVSGASAVGGAKNLLAGPLQDLANFIGTDNTDAITLSTKIPNLQDLNGKACWMMTADFTAVVQAHPIPLTFKFMTDIEGNRLLVWSAYNLCHSTACGIVFNDLQTEATQLAGGLAIPNVFTQICGRIANLAPQLPAAALPANVTAPAPAPSTTTTPAATPAAPSTAPASPATPSTTPNP